MSERTHLVLLPYGPNTRSMGSQSGGGNEKYTRSHRALSVCCNGRVFFTANFHSKLTGVHYQDTEFPGVVARPIGNFKTSSDYHYQTMRCNVDLLKIIQVGITLANEQGEFPQECSTWQFNFRFSLA